MSHFKQIIRTFIAVLVGVGYLGTLPGVTPVLTAVMMDHGHEHVMQVSEHEGHSDLVFHHDEHEDDAPAWDHDDEHEHGCHVVQLPTDDAASVASATWLQAPVQLAVEVCFALPPVIAGWRLSEMPMRARPPPLCGSGVLLCLRTTVILV